MRLAWILPCSTFVDATIRQEGSEPASYATAVLAPFVDAWTAARARFAILAAGGSALSNVTVEAIRGSIILAGDVASDAARAQAEVAVRTWAGGVGISNQIRVRGKHCLRPGGSDAEIRTAVAARLRHAPELRGSIVTIDSVYDGVVRLIGAAENAAVAALAFDLAIEVPGVRRVINDVALQLPAAEDDESDAA
jgi:osmotically-inducible protein OsmY